jgi:putative inorganic carbon (HCO3(-)) transporter
VQTRVAAPVGRSPRTFGVLSWCAQALLIASLFWGAFAFGAVYPWAYWPLAGGAVGVALLSFLATPAGPPLHLGPLAFALTLFAASVALQLVPVPSEWLRVLSSRALDVVMSFDLGVRARTDSHALSIAPPLTATGLVLFASFSLLVAGSARLVTIRGPHALARAVAIIGVLLAMAAIIQKPLSTGKIYGFWTPETAGEPFGPFVNKNHFAGWMVMALPLTLGLLCGAIARGMRGVKPTMRDRLLWLSSPEANRLVLLAGASAIMTLALVLTMSRSGISATILALSLTGVLALRRLGTTTRRAIATGYLVVVVVLIAAWVGVDTIGSRFAGANWSDLNGRRGPWADAAGIASMFPLTGTGLNTYGVAMLFYQQHDLARYYSQAHNDYLQLAAEGGVLLIVPAVLCVAALGTVVWKRFKEETSTSGYWVRVGAVTGLSAIALQETVEFSLQMPGNAALFAVLCGIALHATPARHPPTSISPTLPNRTTD